MALLVGATWLADRLRDSAATTLVLDTRKENECSSGGICSSVRITSNEMLLRRLKKGTIKMDSLLPREDDIDKYSAAKASEDFLVVIFDQNSTNEDSLTPECTATLLLKIISSECKQVAFLEGGYESFRKLHPELCQSTTKILGKLSTLDLKPIISAQLELDVSDKLELDVSDRTDYRAIGKPVRLLPYLYLGCRDAAESLQGLRQNGITRILNVTTHIPNFYQGDGITYKQIPVEDSFKVDMLPHLEGALQFIEETRTRGEKVLVHCHAGRSRSVTVVVAYLIKFYNYTLKEALKFVGMHKPDVSPNLIFMCQLVEFEGMNCSRVSLLDSGLGSSPVTGSCFMPNLPISLTAPTSDFRLDHTPRN